MKNQMWPQQHVRWLPSTGDGSPPWLHFWTMFYLPDSSAALTLR
jgi:hypothetical protein